MNIPPTTVEIARAASPKGNIYISIRDHLGHLYEDSAFEILFRYDCGQSAYSPGQCILKLGVLKLGVLKLDVSEHGGRKWKMRRAKPRVGSN